MSTGNKENGNFENGSENLLEVFNKHFDDYLEKYGVATPKTPQEAEKPVVKPFPKGGTVEEDTHSDVIPDNEDVEISDIELESTPEVDEFYEPETFENAEELATLPVDDEESTEPVPLDDEDEYFVASDDEIQTIEDDEELTPSNSVVEEGEEDIFYDPEAAVETLPETEEEEEATESPAEPQNTVEREILREVLVVDRDQARDLGYSADRYLQEQPHVTTPQTGSQPTQSAPPVHQPDSYRDSQPPRADRPSSPRTETRDEKKNGWFGNIFGGNSKKEDTSSNARRDIEARYAEKSRFREEGNENDSYISSEGMENAPISLKTQEGYDAREERLRLQHVATEKRDVDPAIWLEETMLDALKLDASDLHIVVDGETRDLRARIRVDGQMRDFDYVQGVPARVIMGRLKAATELSSGGSFEPEETIYTLELDGENRKARAVLFRTHDGGEALVMRLPLTGNLKQLDDLDFADYNLDLVYKLLAMPYKLIMIAGPMGSGKTTTAHGALLHVSKPTRTVWTIEDPVERRLPNLVQLEVDDENGAGFDVLLAKLLRADYNTLFLGEIRDRDTASAAVKQAKAGRQVMSTIHADDNIKSLQRLIELAGDSPLSVLSAVGGVISQRLVRRLNPEWDGTDPDTKYKGRIPIHEILFVNDSIIEVMMEGRTLSEIKNAASEAVGSSFVQDANRLIAAGITDREEIVAVIGDYDEK